MRALADAPWSERGDAATMAAPRAGADEVGRLTRALDAERDTVAFHVDLAESALRDLHAVCDALDARARRGDPLPSGEVLVGVAQALRAQAGVPTAEVERLAAVARGAQYREREALAVVAVLRARLDEARETLDDVEPRLAKAHASIARLARDGAKGDASDAGLGARSIGAAARQWRQCSRCGRCFWLADTEAVPAHQTSDDPRLARACGAVTGEGSEGR